MTVQDSKYITFKRADWDQMVKNGQLYPESVKRWAEENGLKDSVVIRTRDAFAAAALNTYANSIAISAKVLGELAPSTRDRLLRVADYFHQRAEEAADQDGKLPD
jgi:hypothetical protein